MVSVGGASSRAEMRQKKDCAKYHKRLCDLLGYDPTYKPVIVEQTAAEKAQKLNLKDRMAQHAEIEKKKAQANRPQKEPLMDITEMKTKIR